MKKLKLLIPPKSVGGDVYALVACLTASEKGIVQKTWLKTTLKKQPLHAQLFEAIANKGISNDAAAHKALKINSGAQFSNLKQHLINDILDVLVSARREESSTSQLYFGLMELQFLAERGQVAIARRLCKKQLAIAETTGQYNLALELIYHKSRLVEQNSWKQYATDMEEIAAQISHYTACQHTQQKIQRYTDLLGLLRTADQLLLASPEQDEAVSGVISELAGLQSASGATLHLQLRHLAASITGYYMLRNFDTCTAACEQALHMLEAHPSLASANAEAFLSIANIAFYNEFAKGGIPRVSDWLSRFDRLAARHRNDSQFHKRWAIIRFNTILKVAHKTADYDGVARLVDQDSPAIISYVADVMPADGLSVISSLCISLFVLERYAAAEDLMLEIKQRNRGLERQDIFYFTLVFHLVILYELKDWHRLDAATEAAYHVLYNRKTLRPFEKELMRFLKALPAKRGKGGTAEFIQAFLARLEIYRSDPAQRLYLLYFNYYDWLQSKLAGISYTTYKRRLLRDAPLAAN